MREVQQQQAAMLIDDPSAADIHAVFQRERPDEISYVFYERAEAVALLEPEHEALGRLQVDLIRREHELCTERHMTCEHGLQHAPQLPQVGLGPWLERLERQYYQAVV